MKKRKEERVRLEMLAVAGLFFLRIGLPLLILLAVGALIERSDGQRNKEA